MNSNIVLEKIQRQSQLTPNAIAIKHGEESLRYSDLMCFAQNLSIDLLEAGASKNSIIPIISQGGIDYTISLLAVWMSGAAFVPIDAEAPAPRISRMLNTLGSEIILNTTKNRFTNATMHYNHSEHSQKIVGNLKPQEMGDTSYGFFTSGTTGEPKCCLNQHKGLANRFEVMSQTFKLNAGDAVLQNSKHTFDSSLWQLLWPLTVGGKVVIPHRDGILDIQSTLDIIKEEQVVMADFVPSVLSIYMQFMTSIDDGANYFGSFRNILVGGEEVTLNLVKTIQLMCPWIQVTNTYGPTEASIGFVFHHFTGEETDTVPLGKAIANTNYALVDDQLNEITEPGMLGQIAVLGVGIGLGYIGLPELTAQRFTHIHRSSGLKEPCYLTGDIGSVDNGLLHFHGREDNQVQLNGVRLELTEIETAIEAIENVTCAKVTIDENNNSKRILAVVTGDVDLNEIDLRDKLSTNLPPEFIPKKILQVTDFPRNVNGKVDRNKLLALFKTKSEVCHTRPEIVELLSNYCTSSAINPQMNFEALGIDSINLICIAIEIEKKFGKRISSRELADISTVGELESIITTARTPAVIPSNTRSFAKPLQHVGNELKFTESIFISGGSGYFGIHLLCELLVETHYKAICLVRANSNESAELRLRTCAEKYKIDHLIDWTRVTVVAGDITKHKMGLSDEVYDSLALETTHVLHSAAIVNFNKSTEALRLPNAQGVTEVCKFALRAHARKFHYVSSLAVESVLNNNSPTSGYAQTKFEGEKRVSELTRFDVEVTISRVGDLMPSDKYKVPNDNSLLVSSLRVFKSLNQLVTNSGNVSYTPIDVACSAIASIFNSKLEAHELPQIIPLYPQRKVSLKSIVESLATSASGIQYKEPKHIVEQMITKSETSTLNKDEMVIIDTLMNAEGREQWHLFDKSTEHRNTRKSVHYWPCIDRDYLQRNLKEI
ncbi:AMP-binding protein [Vibrio owensii]|uniref:AMP-binding protein n=1 Tax=Vibrio owensii TaxID=696485 RepID=UPI0018F23B4F|nr:AMP-binding protein [Vibrio owensii]